MHYWVLLGLLVITNNNLNISVFYLFLLPLYYALYSYYCFNLCFYSMWPLASDLGGSWCLSIRGDGF